MNLGTIGEDEACGFLKKNGCKILGRNYRTPRGEIDIIARLGKIVLFVEVKTRSKSSSAQPWESVGFRKRKNLKLAAKAYVQEHRSNEDEYRFDVLSIIVNENSHPEIEWIQNAF
jgi:putative endonuclease